MSRKKGKSLSNKKGGENMAVLAKPINKIAVVRKEESSEFVKDFNKNKVSKEFMASCNKAGKLFKSK